MSLILGLCARGSRPWCGRGVEEGEARITGDACVATVLTGLSVLDIFPKDEVVEPLEQKKRM
jgi:hypothetical protein